MTTRDEIIKFRATAAEAALIRRYAGQCGETPSAYIRRVTLRPDAILSALQFEAFEDALDQLRGAATNLNQLAFQVNRKAEALPDTDTLEEIAAHLALFREVVDLLRASMTAPT